MLFMARVNVNSSASICHWWVCRGRLPQPHAKKKRVDEERKKGIPYANIEEKECALANAAPCPNAVWMVPVLAQRLRICKNHYQGGGDHDINVVCISNTRR